MIDNPRYSEANRPVLEIGLIEFVVRGIPIPQGSMKGFVPKTCHVCGGGRRAILTSDNPKLKAWRKLVREEAIVAMGWLHPAGRNIPLRIEALFFLPRAKSNKAIDAIKRPDIDKLLRGCLDAMTGVVYSDDSQIIEAHVFKAYGNPRVEIRVEEVGLLAVPRQARPLKDEEIPY